MPYQAEPRDDITALPAGEHEWTVAIRGDVPIVWVAPATVCAPSAFAARALAEMLHWVRAAEIPRDALVLTRVSRC